MVADKFYDQERPIPINLHNDCICALTVYYQGYDLKLLDCIGKLNSLSNWPITEPCKQIMRWTSDWRVWIKKAKKWMKPIYMYITITKGSGTKYNWMQICRESVSCSLMILKTTWGSYHKDQDLHDRKDWNFSTYKGGPYSLLCIQYTGFQVCNETRDGVWRYSSQRGHKFSHGIFAVSSMPSIAHVSTHQNLDNGTACKSTATNRPSEHTTICDGNAQ